MAEQSLYKKQAIDEVERQMAGLKEAVQEMEVLDKRLVKDYNDENMLNVGGVAG